MDSFHEKLDAETVPGVCTLDPDSGILVTPRGSQPVRSKTRSVLLYLIGNKGKTISTDELRAAVWGRSHGSEHGPKQCIRELRLLLSDELEKPNFIETVGRQGYRFVGDIRLLPSGGEHAPSDVSPAAGAGGDCFGREQELALLVGGFERAQAGNPSIYMLTGEPGAGKTTIINQFTTLLARRNDVGVLWGQCIPYHGVEEPYRPLLEMLVRASGQSDGRRLRQLLQESAPSWVAQLPGIFPARMVKEKQIALMGTGASRMPRELTFVIEELARFRPLVMVIEDVHWSDPSTLSWLAAWAVRQTRCPLMVVCSTRSGASLERRFPAPLASGDTRRGGRLVTVHVEGMSPEAVGAYLNARFPGNDFPDALAPALTRRTAGHAIFVDTLVSEWQVNGGIAPRNGIWSLDVPIGTLMGEMTPSARALVDYQIAGLSPEEGQLLQAASVAGVEFCAAALAQSAEDILAVERRCEALVNHGQFIRRTGVMSIDAVTQTLYAFRHELYHEAIYASIPRALRAALHGRVGICLESAYGRRSGEISTVLANHFEIAGDFVRAVRYRQRSVGVLLERGANREAEAHARRGLSLIPRLPDNSARRWAELRLQVQLAASAIVNDGFATATVSDALRKAQSLLGSNPDKRLHLLTLIGIWNYHLTRAELDPAKVIAASLDSALTRDLTPQLLMAVHNSLGIIRWLSGDFEAAARHIDKTRSLYDRKRHWALSRVFGEDPGVVCRQYGTIVHQLLGQPEVADELYREGLEIAHALNQPFGMAQMQWGGAVAAREHGDIDRLSQRASDLIETCERADSRFWLPGGNIMAGWAKAKSGNAAEGIRQLETGIRMWDDMGVSLTRPFSLALLADGYNDCGRNEDSRRAMSEAFRLMEETGERWFEASARKL